jgi:hypothetical protein
VNPSMTDQKEVITIIYHVCTLKKSPAISHEFCFSNDIDQNDARASNSRLC